MSKVGKVLLVANLGLWIYFWIAFAHASYPYRPNPLGHPAGTGYTFWGHSIAVVESGLLYPFFKTVYWIEFPSFLLAMTAARAVYHPVLFYGFFAGISKGGWFLLAVMVLSFFQWYFIGWAIEKLCGSGSDTRLRLRAAISRFRPVRTQHPKLIVRSVLASGS